MANNKECNGCPFWKWHPKDRIYDTPGYHSCDMPDYCERYKKKKIERKDGLITNACIKDICDNLPIEVFVNYENKPHRVIKTTAELKSYLFGALPFVLTSYYRHKEDGK